MEKNVEKSLYELIGRLFTEGRDMQTLIHQLQDSLQSSIEANEKSTKDNFDLTHKLTKAQSDISTLNRQIKALTNGQEQA
jgi:hypothetical protein